MLWLRLPNRIAHTVRTPFGDKNSVMLRENLRGTPCEPFLPIAMNMACLRLLLHHRCVWRGRRLGRMQHQHGGQTHIDSRQRTVEQLVLLLQ
jgi:hypothetical protein